MWTTNYEPIEGGIRCTFFDKGQPMSFVDVVKLLLFNASFQGYFAKAFADAPLDSYRVEVHPLIDGYLLAPFEYVLLDDPELDRFPDRGRNSEGFAEWPEHAANYPTDGVVAIRRMCHMLLSRGEASYPYKSLKDQEKRDPHFGSIYPAVDFLNAAQDTFIRLPTPQHDERCYRNHGAFMREAGEHQRSNFWYNIANVMMQWTSTVPLFVGTPKNGPAWLHIRIDRKPFFTYQPYLDFVANPPPPPPAPPPPPPKPKRTRKKKDPR